MKRLAAILLLVSCFFSCREEEPALLFDIEGLWVENYDEYGYTALREGVPSYMFNNDNSWEFTNIMMFLYITLLRTIMMCKAMSLH